MVTPKLANAHVMQGGHLVSGEISRIIEAIRQYEPELDVEWVPPAARREGQAAFAIVHRPRGGEDYVLFYVKDEADFDERVLRRIIYNDQRSGKQVYNEFAAAERARELVQQQKHADELEAAADVAAHILKSHKNTYKVSDDLIIKDGIPFNIAKIGRRR